MQRLHNPSIVFVCFSAQGISVCDMGCSAGFVTLQIAENFPNSSVCGIDFDHDAITIANKKAGDKTLHNVTFRKEDICKLPSDWVEKWDFIFMNNVLHDLSFPEKGLKEMYRTLKTGSYIGIVDVNMHTKLEDNMENPSSPLLYGISLFNCLPTALYLGGEGLGAAMGWEKAKSMIAEAGFKDVTAVPASSDVRSKSKVLLIAKK